MHQGRCVHCSAWDDGTAVILDPAKWEVAWVCRDHRTDEITRWSKPPEVDPAVVRQIERERTLAAIAALFL